MPFDPEQLLGIGELGIQLTEASEKAALVEGLLSWVSRSLVSVTVIAWSNGSCVRPKPPMPMVGPLSDDR